MGGRAWLTAGLLLLSPSAAWAADIEWALSKKDGRAYLSGMPKQSEVDNEFWAHCRADGAIEVGAGAESHAAAFVKKASSPSHETVSSSPTE